MQQVKTILLSKSVFEDNDAAAELLRSELREKKVCLVNVMSSPGSGKTTLLVALINALKQSYNIGVMEADIDSDKDAVTVAEKTGVRSIQLHTGGMCHLDAEMTRQGLEELGDGLDLIFLENVGTLPYFDFNMDECREYIRARNPDASVIAVSAKTGDNMGELIDRFVRILSER